MINLNGNDLLNSCLISNNVDLKMSNNNPINNPTQSSIDEFKNMLTALSFRMVSSKGISNDTSNYSNDVNSNEDCEEKDILKINSEDILILDIGESDNFFNTVSSLVTLLDNDKLEIKDLIELIENVNSMEELEDAMSKLLSQLSIPTVLIDNPILNEDNSSLSNINFEAELVEPHTNPIMVQATEDFSSVDISEKNNNNIDKLISYLESSNEPLTDKDITSILSKLNKIYNKDESKIELNSNKKKEVTVSLDNFNIDIAHNKAINLNGVEFSEEIQGASSKILEKITTVIHEHMSMANLNNKTIKIRLKLYPKHLGELTIDILNHEGKMNIKIFSENPSIKEYISSSMKELINSLNDKNLAVDEIEVLTLKDANSSFNNNSNSNSSNHSNSSQKLTKFNNYINYDDINDENLNNFESYETSERNLYVNI